MSASLSPQRIAEIRHVLDSAVTEMNQCGHATATPEDIGVSIYYQPGEYPIFDKCAMRLPELVALLDCADDWTNGTAAKDAEIAALTKQRDTMRAFITDLLDAWRFDGDLDGGDVQDLCVKHGILAPVTVHAPCGDHCTCAESADAYDWQRGVTCFRKTPLIGGDAPESVAADYDAKADSAEVKP